MRPLDLGDGLGVSGSLVTDDATGAVVDRHVAVRSTTRLAHYTPANTGVLFEDLFDTSNSVMSANGLAYKAALGGRRHAVSLANFSDDAWPGGKAAYYRGRQALYERPLAARRGAWRVTGSDAVPVAEPQSLALLLCAALGAWASRRQRTMRRLVMI